MRLRTAWTARRATEDRRVPPVSIPGRDDRLLVVVPNVHDWSIDDVLLLLTEPVLRLPRGVRVLLGADTAALAWPTLWHHLDKSGTAHTVSFRV